MKCRQCAMKIELLERELGEVKRREAELARINNALTRAIMAQPYVLPDHLWKEKYEQQAERNVQLCKLLLANGQNPEPILKMRKSVSNEKKQEKNFPSECPTAKKKAHIAEWESEEQPNKEKKKHIKMFKSSKERVQRNCKKTS